MDNNTTKERSDAAILTGGLRRMLLGVIAVGFVLAAIQIMAVTRLQHEIDHWAWISEVNAQRERLLGVTDDLLDGNGDTELPEVLTSFDALRHTTDGHSEQGESGGYARRFARLEAEARDLFVQSEERRTALLPHRGEIFRAVDGLQDLMGFWATQLRLEEQRILQESSQIDLESRQIADLEAKLTSVLLGAQLLQQQIIAVERLIETSPETILRSTIAGLDTSVLPQVCAAGEEETNGRLCSPNVGRLRSAVERLQSGSSSNIAEDTRQTLWALEAYIRAGQGRLADLSNANSEALNRTRLISERLSSLRDLTASLGRINRLLLDLDATAREPFNAIENVEVANGKVRSLTSQIELRMNGLLGISDIFHGNSEDVIATTGIIRANWSELRNLAAQRITLLDEFESTMDTLSIEIADHADRVRKDTTLWVNVYASNFLLFAAFFAASIVGFFWFARKRFVLPLSRVTRAILGLARGELERPVIPQERAFGFDRLGAAIERLRLEMIERRTLSERNIEQQRIIEANLAELERTNDEMEWLAMHDPLTGLGNRRHADQVLEALTADSKRSNADFCVMQIDIDRFKTINDALGHSAGDFVLRTVSTLLQEIVGSDAECYRIGGDEFLVILAGQVSTEKASRIAASLIDQIRAPIDFRGHRCNVGASIGISFGRDAGFDAMLALVNSDLALYQVKRKGRNGYEFFSDELARLSRRRKEIADRLIVAMDEKSFQPYYQPQFHAKSRDLRGLEVLCRWHDSELGWIPPVEFLSVADDLGAVGRIDEILFGKVAQDLQKLSESGISVPRVSLNITADRLLKTGLAQELSEAIGGKAIIALELLESMSLDDPSESVLWAIDKLKEKGIEIEIDDFGSDRASLAGVMAINPQAMKIDRGIVIPIVDSQRHRDLVKKIIDIGAALNVEVVAEGVETEEHAKHLTMLGCNALQGYGLARPMPFEDLVDFCGGMVLQGRNTGAVA